jgi:hypothetical protein
MFGCKNEVNVDHLLHFNAWGVWYQTHRRECAWCRSERYSLVNFRNQLVVIVKHFYFEGRSRFDKTWVLNHAKLYCVLLIGLRVLHALVHYLDRPLLLVDLCNQVADPLENAPTPEDR